MLDEVDKIGADYRAIRRRRCSSSRTRKRTTPSAILSQRAVSTLSNVLFVATANLLDSDPAGLPRSMEVIGLSATRRRKDRDRPAALIRSRIDENGLTTAQIDLAPKAIRTVIQKVHPRGGAPEPGARDRQGLPEAGAPVAEGQNGPYT